MVFGLIATALEMLAFGLGAVLALLTMVVLFGGMFLAVPAIASLFAPADE